MTALMVSNALESSAIRTMLETRWQINRRSLANARNRVEIAVASLDCIVADRGVIEAMVGRWVADTFDDLDRLDLENELPRVFR